mmetsp:Transcript_41610/g.163491  ORF Transcript_41610/g.163491 Transcript_41610/m.163491 type:complete len:125 (-) Transcript_41610:264-638(-)
MVLMLGGPEGRSTGFAFITYLSEPQPSITMIGARYVTVSGKKERASTSFEDSGREFSTIFWHTAYHVGEQYPTIAGPDELFSVRQGYALKSFRFLSTPGPEAAAPKKLFSTPKKIQFGLLRATY